jgi:hypothetical protein
MRCDPDHGGRTVRRSRGRPERHCVPRLRRWFGSRQAQADRWCRGGRAQGPIERSLAARQPGRGGRRVMRNERGSAGDDQRRPRECRGRERHRRKRRGPASVALPRAIAAPIHQRCNVESCVRIAIRQRPAVPAFRFGPLASRFEEHAEVERGASVPGSGRLPVRNCSRGQIATLLEQQTELEPFLGGAVIDNRSVSVIHTGLLPFGVNER